MRVKELDVDAAVLSLSDRWAMLDQYGVGVVRLDQLREAVWRYSEHQTKGVSMPPPHRPLPKDLQAIVDDIHRGVGRKERFTFWDFATYFMHDLAPEPLAKFQATPPPYR